MIKRAIEQQVLDEILGKHKVIIIYGARQVGKTTMVNSVLSTITCKKLLINADEKKYGEVLSSRDFRQLYGLVQGYDLLFIDEAQRISDIGINLKILHDQLPELKIIVTGSSSFDLANKITEPLTGRILVHNLYPISFYELGKMHTPFELSERVPEALIYGTYPEVFSISNITTKKRYLEQLTQSYLYKDIFELADVRNSLKIQKLLKLLAYQIGSEVSLAELGKTLEMSKDTVARYIDLLEKSFVIFRLSGLHRNLRKEVSKMDKIYFYDLGIRNIVIDNLNSLHRILVFHLF